MKIRILLATILLCACGGRPVIDLPPSEIVRVLHVETLASNAITVYAENPYRRLGVVLGQQQNFALSFNDIRKGTLTVSLSDIGGIKARLQPLNVSSTDWRFDLYIQGDIRNSFLSLHP